MSWDIFVQDIPAAALSVADIPDDFAPQLIGTRAQVVATVADLVPTADVSDPS